MPTSPQDCNIKQLNVITAFIYVQCPAYYWAGIRVYHKGYEKEKHTAISSCIHKGALDEMSGGRSSPKWIQHRSSYNRAPG